MASIMDNPFSVGQTVMVTGPKWKDAGWNGFIGKVVGVHTRMVTIDGKSADGSHSGLAWFDWSDLSLVLTDNNAAQPHKASVFPACRCTHSFFNSMKGCTCGAFKAEQEAKGVRA